MKRYFVNLIILTACLIFSGAALPACSSAKSTAQPSEKAAGETGQPKKTDDGGGRQAKNSPETAQTGEPKTLWDFRKTGNFKPQTFSKAETDAVAEYLFGETDSKIEIRDRLSGAFTKPNAKETLYYLTGCKDETTDRFTTDCPHVSWDSVGWIAIFDGTTPVLKIEEALGFGIEKTTDVDGDGKNEFLSFSGYGQGGIQTGGAALGQISGGRYDQIKTFGGYGDNCAFGGGVPDDKLSARASVIFYVPAASGKMPEFSRKFYKGQCKNSEIDESSWKETTEKDFDDFINSIS